MADMRLEKDVKNLETDVVAIMDRQDTLENKLQEALKRIAQLEAAQTTRPVLNIVANPSSNHVYGAKGVCDRLGLDARKHGPRVSTWNKWSVPLKPDPSEPKIGKADAFKISDVDAFGAAFKDEIERLKTLKPRGRQTA